MKKNFYINLEPEIKEIFRILSNISKTYIVGGFIRDNLLGIQAKDYDFCTDLALDKMLEIFSNEKFKVKIISEPLNIIELKYKNKKIEVARMRKDLKYYGNRKEFNFIFVDNIEEDLIRRDFTINSIAYDGENIIFLNKKILEDIENKKIKFLGNSQERILEDPFRILRAFRFFSEKKLLDFDKEDLKIIEKNKNLIWNLSTEMIQGEFIKIIKGDNYLRTFELMNEINLFNEKFFISYFKENYKERLKELFKNSNFSLLKKLKFSKKIIRFLEKDLKY